MKKIAKMNIFGFEFEIQPDNQEKKISAKGNIIPEYCRVIPFQDRNGNLKLKVNIAIEIEETKEKQYTIIVCESSLLFPHSFETMDVVFYDLYTINNGDDIEEFHIIIEESEENKE